MRGVKTKQVKQELFQYYQPPEPDRKQKLLQQLPKEGIRSWQFMWIQAAYLSKWIWGFSLALFSLLLIACHMVHWDMVWIMASFAPFIAASLLVECARPYAYGMEELELSARFSLKSILMARMGILAVFHFLLLLLMVLLCLRGSGIWWFRAGISILLPYFTSISIGLPIVRHYHGRESGYICAAIAVIVCVLSGYLQETLKYHEENWLILFLGLLLIAEMLFDGAESMKLLKQSEELGTATN